MLKLKSKYTIAVIFDLAVASITSLEKVVEIVPGTVLAVVLEEHRI